MLWIKKKKSTAVKSKSRKKTKAKPKQKSEIKKTTNTKNINKYIDSAFRLVLKSVVESFCKTFSAEDVIKTFKVLEFEIFKYKEQILSALTELPSISDREKVWDKVKELFVEILLPMITVMNTNIATNLSKKEEVEEDTPLEIPNIGIVSRKSAKDIATVKSRIVAPNSEKTLVYHKTIVDTGSDTSLISKSIASRLDMEIDKTNSPELSGIATQTGTIGTVYGVGITIYDNDNSQTIEDDFMVINTDKDFVLLGIPWLDRARTIVDLNSRILQIPISQRKSIIVPISLHRRKTNATSLNIDNFELKKK
jgi:hypothetical protein